MNRETFLKFVKYLGEKKPFLVRGCTGAGKSSIIRQFAASSGRQFIPLDLYNYEPPDLVGHPIIENGQTTYAKPFWWPNPETKSLLLLEEIDRCNRNMQPLMMGLILDRRVANHRLPDNCMIGATANGSKYGTNDLGQALMRRFATIDLKVEVGEWLDWAEKNKVNETVRSFIADNNGLLDPSSEIEGKPNIPIPCRPTWVELGSFLDKNPIVSEFELQEMVASFVGLQAARTFVSWLKIKESLGSVEDVFAGKMDPAKCSPFLAAYLVSGITRQISKASETEQINALDFLLASGNEIFASFVAHLDVKDLPIIEKHKKAKKATRMLMEIAAGD